jgi:hypothetical protein
VFHAAGFSGFGVFDAAVSQSNLQGRHLWAIGVDNDQWFEVDPDERRHVLTSMIKRGAGAAYLLTRQFIEGDFMPGVQSVGMAEGAYDFSTQGDGLTASMIAELESIKVDIAEGRISVPTEPSGELLVVDRSDLDPFTAFGTGTYTMNELGTPVAFTATGSWSTELVLPGFFVISASDSTGAGHHDIIFARPTQLLDPVSGAPTLPVEDLEGWLDAVPDTLSISEPEATMVAGLDALTFDAVVSNEAECLIDCVPFLMVGSITGGFDAVTGYFDRGFLYHVVWIDHVEGPIVIAGRTTEDDPDWLSTARAVIETLEIG